MQPGPADELVWWKFDETSGTTASDASGNGNAGTLTNMASTMWTAGKIGNALSFDGANDYVVRSALSSTITGDCTVGVWMNRSGVPSSNCRLFDLAIATAEGLNIGVQANNGYIFIDNNGGMTDEFAGTQNLCDGSWHSPGWNPLADANADGVVNINDLTLVTANFGKTYP